MNEMKIVDKKNYMKNAIQHLKHKKNIKCFGSKCLAFERNRKYRMCMNAL